MMLWSYVLYLLEFDKKKRPVQFTMTNTDELFELHDGGLIQHYKTPYESYAQDYLHVYLRGTRNLLFDMEMACTPHEFNKAFKKAIKRFDLPNMNQLYEAWNKHIRAFTPQFVLLMGELFPLVTGLVGHILDWWPGDDKDENTTPFMYRVVEYFLHLLKFLLVKKADMPNLDKHIMTLKSAMWYDNLENKRPRTKLEPYLTNDPIIRSNEATSRGVGLTSDMHNYGLYQSLDNINLEIRKDFEVNPASTVYGICEFWGNLMKPDRWTHVVPKLGSKG